MSIEVSGEYKGCKITYSEYGKEWKAVGEDIGLRAPHLEDLKKKVDQSLARRKKKKTQRVKAIYVNYGGIVLGDIDETGVVEVTSCEIGSTRYNQGELGFWIASNGKRERLQGTKQLIKVIPEAEKLVVAMRRGQEKITLLNKTLDILGDDLAKYTFTPEELAEEIYGEDWKKVLEVEDED